MRLATLLPFIGLLATAINLPAFGGEVRAEWTDAQRHREVPVRMFVPENARAPYPIVVFSHGLGGSRDAGSYLGEHWSSRGYFVLYVQHHGSDKEIWMGQLKNGGGRAQAKQAVLQTLRASANLEQLSARVEDVHFVLDKLTELNTSDPSLKGKLDLQKIAIAGHSFGAGTALATVGQSFGPNTKDLQFRDSRIKCAIYLSPPVNPVNREHPECFSEIQVPGMLMTGTNDASEIGLTKPEDRQIPFYAFKAPPDQYLVVFIGGDHMVFNGHLLRGKEMDERLHPKILQLSTAFLDAYLRGDQKQRTWLKNDAEKSLQGYATFKTRP